MGITQENLARILGVSLRTILRWESGKFSPSKANWVKVWSLFP